MNQLSARDRATLTGFGAILLWGMLALLTSYCGNIPPFQLTAMTFLIAFLVGVASFLRQGKPFHVLRQPAGVWLNGVIGLFGYHALYFMAMQHAPAIEASLINYLWPVLIVLFASFLPNEKLRWTHVLGVALGFIGVMQLLLGGGKLELDSRYAGGYAMAFACAVLWALYSVNSRRHQQAPTVLIGAFCGVTALLSLVCHLLFESTVIPAPREWLAIVLLGVGPVGLALFAWDHGMKHGNIKLLGALSYIAPLLSSVLLICFGRAEFRWNVLAACAFIISGSVVASLRLRRSQAPEADNPSAPDRAR
ncbi:MAG TPA: EamA family transporter [Candidatus Limiplasma sp.]|nr:EamA family transporter [Candidatus Limiplasma sp.]